MENKENQEIGIGKIPAFIRKIEAKIPELSRQHKQVANYLIHNLIHASYLNTAQLAEEAGVSPATVVRFATEMGYKGFPDMKKELRWTVQVSLEGKAVLEVDPQKSSNALQTSISVAQQMLQNLADNRDDVAFSQAVNLIFQARKVVVFGHKASFGVAAHCAYVLSKVHSDVSHVLGTNSFDSFSKLDDLDHQDVAVVFMVIQYPTATLNLMRMLAKRGVKIVLVSDFKTVPEASLASVALLVSISFVGCFDVVTPLLVVADALAYGVYRKDEEKAKRRLLRFNRFNEEDQAFRQVCRFAD